MNHPRSLPICHQDPSICFEVQAWNTCRNKPRKNIQAHLTWTNAYAHTLILVGLLIVSFSVCSAQFGTMKSVLDKIKQTWNQMISSRTFERLQKTLKPQEYSMLETLLFFFEKPKQITTLKIWVYYPFEGLPFNCSSLQEKTTPKFRWPQSS